MLHGAAGRSVKVQTEQPPKQPPESCSANKKGSHRRRPNRFKGCSSTRQEVESGLATIHLPMAAPINLTLNMNMNWRVLLYGFLISIAVGMLCGLWPALAASRPVLPNSLKGESALDRPGRRRSLRNILVVVQISLSVVLVCTTGLFLRSLSKSAAVYPGFRTSGVLMASIDPMHNGYPTEQTPLLLRLRNRVISLPGVRSAVWTDKIPVSFYGQRDVFCKTADKAENGLQTEVYGVEAGYFDTIGIAWVAAGTSIMRMPMGRSRL